MIVLASASSARRTLLQQAGIAFEALSSDVDERRIEALLSAGGASPGDRAQALADAKAMAVLPLRPEDTIIGADQILELDGVCFAKPGSRAAAADHLARLAGRTHRLHAAASIVIGDRIVWRHVAVAAMTMRPLSSAQIERYLDEAGEGVVHSVGAYWIEGIGIRLFSAIDGDYFSILGLPMLPLLEALRTFGALES